MVALRILGVLPPSGSKQLLSILSCTVFLGYSGIIMATAMIGAMIADTTDEHELRTGRRQEGLLFSANTLIAKTSTGFGSLVAGALVFVVGFPDRATPDNVDPGVVTRLGAFAALVNLSLGIVGVLLIRRYVLSRQRHTEILSQLEQRASAGSA
jgi:Na+/melibiose symporter-like transporter